MSSTVSPAQKKNILMTGPPGIGKTTAIERIAMMLREEAGGFCTKEIREGNERKGFGISSLDGERGVLAHADLEGHHKVGKYVVNISDLDRIGVGAIRRAIEAGKVVIVDEIGKMELFSTAFRSAVLEVLDSPSPVIATIMDKEDSFCDLIKKRSDVQVVRLTKDNRDAVPEEVVGFLRKYLCSSSQ